MKEKVSKGFSIIGYLSVIAFGILFIILYKGLKNGVSENVLITIITLLGVLLTITSSLFIVKMTERANLKLKRAEDVRNVKLKYYYKFCEAYVNKYLYSGFGGCNEEVQASMEFVREANRLPLYASKEVIEFIENLKNPEKAKEKDFGELYTLIRNDLNNDDFELFEDKLNTQLTITNKVIVKDEHNNAQVIDRNNPVIKKRV